MPFLSELSQQSLLFTKHLANGRRSIEVLPSVLCGLPALIDEPISKSIFSGNRFVCMPKVLKASGYTNYFFHGGARGTMGFESYTLSNGFDRYFSKDDYPNHDHFDGTWGIYDEPYLKFVAKELQGMPKPFMAGIFTLSSHQPYAVPKELKGKFPKGTLEIHESIGYTDYAVKAFFEKIKKESWFENTIFIITADHTQKLESKKFENLIGHYRVPLMIYMPSHKLGHVSKVTQHSDIPMTILDMLGIKGDMPLTGVSVFSADKGQAMNYADGSTYFLVKDEKVFTLDKNGKSVAFTYDWETGQQGPATPSEDVLLKANLQYFINGLISNNLSL
jgi:phosphoglycerol transferase MdoB-like AlkP superfamily enzyme